MVQYISRSLHALMFNHEKSPGPFENRLFYQFKSSNSCGQKQFVQSVFCPRPVERRSLTLRDAGGCGLRDKQACGQTLAACLLTGLCEDTTRRILYSRAISTKTQPEHDEWRPFLTLSSSVHVKRNVSQSPSWPSIHRILPSMGIV